jgi:hypothetical protein
LVPTDKDSQRALRIRWVGQNPEEHPEDRLSGQPSNSQGEVRSNSDVDDDDEDVGCLGDRPKVPFGSSSSASTLRSDPRSRFVP